MRHLAFILLAVFGAVAGADPPPGSDGKYTISAPGIKAQVTTSSLLYHVSGTKKISLSRTVRLSRTSM
jgi:hypothetical protein